MVPAVLARRGRTALVVAVAVAVELLAGPAVARHTRAQAGPFRPQVLLYGDSLVYEAEPYAKTSSATSPFRALGWWDPTAVAASVAAGWR